MIPQSVSCAVKQPFKPIYLRLYDEYKEAILTLRLKPGRRIDSINQIMHRHGVARETARRVLKMLADERLIVQKMGQGSFVADLQPVKKIWGVVVPFYSIGYEDLIHHLGEKAWQRGRQLQHFVDYNNWEEEIRLVSDMIHRRYEAVIVIPTLDESRTADFYARLSAKDSFVTLIDHTMAGSFFSYVIQSYDLGVTRGVDYLLRKAGPRRVAFVRNETWAGRSMVEELMEETFRTLVASVDAGREPLVIDRASRVTAAMVAENKIGGLFTCNDSDAIRILGRLRAESGRDMQGISLVNYGNTELVQYFTPAITAIDPHNTEMAAKTARIIDAHVAGESTSLSQYVVQPGLIVRDT
ncbi:MAG: GntR family transcriptional regulator [Chitinivibrionales bacterium]|nr:GntR family transcriptional regulator [Chitinivibrionales bacterium]